MIEGKIDNSTKTLTVNITGDFSLDSKAQFTSSYKGHRDLKKIIINLSQTNMLDSSGLGLLLLLKDHSDEHDIKVILKSPRGIVKESLTVANINRLFTIEP